MKKQNLIIIVIAGLILLGGSFYGGMQYGAKNISKNQLTQNEKIADSFGKGANINGQRMVGGQGGQRGMGGQGANANGGAGDFAGGEIISKDNTSVTIKTRDGGSKIIFFSTKTLIDKSVSGSTGDLSVGQQVIANGKASSDGSITAQNIQIRPTQVSQPVN